MTLFVALPHTLNAGVSERGSATYALCVSLSYCVCSCLQLAMTTTNASPEGQSGGRMLQDGEEVIIAGAAALLQQVIFRCLMWARTHITHRSSTSPPSLPPSSACSSIA